MSFDAAVVMAESLVQQQDVLEEWVGLTVWHLKYGCRIQGTTDVAFTVLDVLGYLDEIPVCVGYDIDGEVTTDFPTTSKLKKAKPVLEDFQDGNVISVESRSTKIFQRTAESTSSSLKSISDTQSP